jgi:predicted nuclease of restriction endonuclease-like RecB superfamily
MGRFGQNISHVMSEVYKGCHLPISFADYQAGKTHVDAQNYRKIPDLVLIDNQRLIRAIGEGKTFWTKDYKERPYNSCSMAWRVYSELLSRNQLT